MTCTRCGAKLLEGSAFCSQCGTHVTNPGPARIDPITAADQSTGVTAAATVAPPPAERVFSYAGFWVRFAANFYDSMALIIPLLIVFAIFAYPFSGTSHNNKGAETIGNLIDWLITWLYYAYFESSPRQATLGKILLKIKVVDLSGNLVSLRRASARYLGKIALWPTLLIGTPYYNWIIGVFIIGFFMVGWTKKKQGLHDKIAGCLVINREDISGRQIWVVVAVGVTVIIPTLLLASLLFTSHRPPSGRW
ncbi:MAG: RDD family protein [Magnetococcales bacterium]|nr:RDD family protein [Magnetococcales bacterium]